MGSASGAGGARKHLARALPRILGRLLAGRYRVGRKTLAHVWAVARAAVRRETLEVRVFDYPANLHIDVLAGHRGRGIGSALMTAYLNRLRSKGVRGVHLVTTNLNETAVRLYRRHGFSVLAEKPTDVWRRHVAGDVRFIAFGLRLSEESPA